MHKNSKINNNELLNPRGIYYIQMSNIFEILSSKLKRVID